MSNDNNIKYCSVLFILLTCSLPTEQRHSGQFRGNHLARNETFENVNIGKIIQRSNTEDTSDKSDCWPKFNVNKHFSIMDKLDEQYVKARASFHQKEANLLNAKMLKAMLDTRGISYRAAHNMAGDITRIPAGLQIGGHCMVVMEKSVLFFYRIKLRNNTVFRVNYLENDLMNMTVEAHLSLNDLHLVGGYERAPKHTDPSILFYVANNGEADVLLKNVNYKMEGRLRLQGNRLVVEAIISEFEIEDILIMFASTSKYRDTSPTRIQQEDFEDFLDRLKHDIDLWLKDYFNDYYTYFPLDDVDPEFRQYEKQRILAYNRFSDYLIKRIKQRIHELDIAQAETPRFTLNALPNVQVQLSKGAIKGLDSIHKKSTAIGMRKGSVRHIDINIGFSNLKVEYQLDVILPNGGPITSGHTQLVANDLTAHLHVCMVQNPETVNFKFYFLKQLKPLALTVEGPPNRLISNYKHLLENHVIILMLQDILTNIRNLATITRCNPYFHPDHGIPQKGNAESRRSIV